MMAERWTYTHGLKDLGNGLYAWLQPDGGWGWSNAGLIRDGDQSLLVDTLFDKGVALYGTGAIAGLFVALVMVLQLKMKT